MNQFAPMICFDNVCFSYGDGEILKKFSLSVRQGEFLCIIGPSGSGKTTLLRLIADLERPTSGVVEVGGQVPAEARKSGHFSYVPQQPSLLPWMNVFHNVALPFKLRGQRIDRNKVDKVLSQVGLTMASSKRPRELSGGMQARAALARAWVDSETSVLLMDEPFASLDEMRREELGELLRTLWSDGSKTIVYVTHDISEAILLGTRILPFAGGFFTGNANTIEVSDDDRKDERGLKLSPLHEDLRDILDSSRISRRKSVTQIRRADTVVTQRALDILGNVGLYLEERIVAAGDLRDHLIALANNPGEKPDVVKGIKKSLSAMWSCANTEQKITLIWSMVDIFHDDPSMLNSLFKFAISPEARPHFIRAVEEYLKGGSPVTHMQERFLRSRPLSGKLFHILNLLAADDEKRAEGLRFLDEHSAILDDIQACENLKEIYPMVRATIFPNQ